jgi:hypothetical protein
MFEFDLDKTLLQPTNQPTNITVTPEQLKADAAIQCRYEGSRARLRNESICTLPQLI